MKTCDVVIGVVVGEMDCVLLTSLVADEIMCTWREAIAVCCGVVGLEVGGEEKVQTTRGKT